MFQKLRFRWATLISNTSKVQTFFLGNWLSIKLLRTHLKFFVHWKRWLEVLTAYAKTALSAFRINKNLTKNFIIVKSVPFFKSNIAYLFSLKKLYAMFVLSRIKSRSLILWKHFKTYDERNMEICQKIKSKVVICLCFVYLFVSLVSYYNYVYSLVSLVS